MIDGEVGVRMFGGMGEGAPCGGKNIGRGAFTNERFCLDCFDTRCDARQCGTVVTEDGVEVHQNAFRADAKRWCEERSVRTVTIVDDAWKPFMLMEKSGPLPHPCEDCADAAGPCKWEVAFRSFVAVLTGDHPHRNTGETPVELMVRATKAIRGGAA